jgi:hypothetical protein
MAPMIASAGSLRAEAPTRLLAPPALLLLLLLPIPPLLLLSCPSPVPPPGGGEGPSAWGGAGEEARGEAAGLGLSGAHARSFFACAPPGASSGREEDLLGLVLSMFMSAWNGAFVSCVCVYARAWVSAWVRGLVVSIAEVARGRDLSLDAAHVCESYKSK